MNDGLGNLAARDIDQLAAIVTNPLERIQGAPARIPAPARNWQAKECSATSSRLQGGSREARRPLRPTR